MKEVAEEETDDGKGGFRQRENTSKPVGLSEEKLNCALYKFIMPWATHTSHNSGGLFKVEQIISQMRDLSSKRFHTTRLLNCPVQVELSLKSELNDDN